MVDSDLSSTSVEMTSSDDVNLRIALDEEEDEELDVVDTPEMEGSVTSCSLSDNSPTVSPPRSSPLTLASILPSSDSPRSSSESSTVSNGSVNGSSTTVPEKRHICDICNKGFPYFSILESHKRCHTGEKPFNCHFCDKKFAQKATLQVHERTHTGERPYKCRYCEKTFAQYGTKTVHEKSAHLGIRNYKCPKCDKCLSSPSALYTHKKTHGEKTFQCEFCPKTFTLKNYLKLHVKQVHEQNERKHVCRFCSKSFAYAGSLQVHVRTHTGERPYSCRFCPKAFASQGNLQSHERTHTGERPYSCGTCGRSFIQKSQLTAHEATHTFSSTTSLPSAPTDTKTPNSTTTATSATTDYVCKYCGRRYAYASSLYVHVRNHTGERPFSCGFCDKTFTNQGNMQVHQRVHTGEKPYSCSACGKSYAQKVGLKIHLEQCQPYLQARGSESPINVDTDSDCSDGSKRTNDCFPLRNIYQNPPSPLSFLPQMTPSFPPLTISDLGIQLPTVSNQLGFPSATNTLTTPAVSQFRAPEIPPADYGPMVASQPPYQPEVSMPEAFSAFSAPVKAAEPLPTLMDTSLLLKNLLDSGLGATLLSQQLNRDSLSQQILSTQLLINQLQSGGDLSSLLHHHSASTTPSTPTPSLPLGLPAPQPLPAPSMLANLFPSSLLGLTSQPTYDLPNESLMAHS